MLPTFLVQSSRCPRPPPQFSASPRLTMPFVCLFVMLGPRVLAGLGALSWGPIAGRPSPGTCLLQAKFFDTF